MMVMNTLFSIGFLIFLAQDTICNIQADFPKHLLYIVINNRTVSTTGKVGYGKPNDQMVEHYNL